VRKTIELLNLGSEWSGRCCKARALPLDLLEKLTVVEQVSYPVSLHADVVSVETHSILPLGRTDACFPLSPY
jgi:hypothetical protein